MLSANSPIMAGWLKVCAVQSTGLRGAQKEIFSFSLACAASGMAGMAKPSASAASEISTPAPPLTVSTPSVLCTG